ncbi:hypothetical protein C8R45DRAFT_989359 [Mycena sanguinolenta]|nr:hypothetical protein C8R45DRAFT_989359 [Mycena sanguinolenta]
MSMKSKSTADGPTEYGKVLVQRYLDRNEKARLRMARKRAELKNRPPEEQAAAAERQRRYQTTFRERNRNDLRLALLESGSGLAIDESTHEPGPEVDVSHVNVVRAQSSTGPKTRSSLRREKGLEPTRAESVAPTCSAQVEPGHDDSPLYRARTVAHDVGAQHAVGTSFASERAASRASEQANEDTSQEGDVLERIRGRGPASIAPSCGSQVHRAHDDSPLYRARTVDHAADFRGIQHFVGKSVAPSWTPQAYQNREDPPLRPTHTANNDQHFLSVQHFVVKSVAPSWRAPGDHRHNNSSLYRTSTADYDQLGTQQFVEKSVAPSCKAQVEHGRNNSPYRTRTADWHDQDFLAAQRFVAPSCSAPVGHHHHSPLHRGRTADDDQTFLGVQHFVLNACLEPGSEELLKKAGFTSIKKLRSVADLGKKKVEKFVRSEFAEMSSVDKILLISALDRLAHSPRV